MQASFFPNYDKKFNSKEKTYRESFGFELPPKGTDIMLLFMDGLGWYLLWKLCPDLENIIHNGSKSELIKLSSKKGWNLKQ